MTKEDLAIAIAVLLAIGNGVYTFGVLTGRIEGMREWMRDEITRVRDRMDQLEKDIRDWMVYWRKQ